MALTEGPPTPGRPTRTGVSSCCRLSLSSRASSWPSRWNSWSCSSSTFSLSSRTCFRSTSFSCRLRACCACSSSRVTMACGAAAQGGAGGGDPASAAQAAPSLAVFPRGGRAGGRHWLLPLSSSTSFVFGVVNVIQARDRTRVCSENLQTMTLRTSPCQPLPGTLGTRSPPHTRGSHTLGGA